MSASRCLAMAKTGVPEPPRSPKTDQGSSEGRWPRRWWAWLGIAVAAGTFPFALAAWVTKEQGHIAGDFAGGVSFFLLGAPVSLVSLIVAVYLLYRQVKAGRRGRG